MGCIEILDDGRRCGRPAFVFDPYGRGMLCRAHALAPLEARFGQRPDLEAKAELVLRFLSLPAAHRHQILEALGPEERREVIAMAGAYAERPPQP